MRGFTLVELMVSVVIMTFLVAALVHAFDVGRNVYDSNSATMEMQRITRQVMGSMVKELRQSRAADITISAGNTRIDFVIPTSINPLTNSSNIRYSITNNQIIREHPTGTQKILATNIDAMTFTLNGADVLDIVITGRVTLKTDDIVFTIRERIGLPS